MNITSRMATNKDENSVSLTEICQHGDVKELLTHLKEHK